MIQLESASRKSAHSTRCNKVQCRKASRESHVRLLEKNAFWWRTGTLGFAPSELRIQGAITLFPWSIMMLFKGRIICLELSSPNRRQRNPTVLVSTAPSLSAVNLFLS